ncbi:DUF2252 domain-containing protein [Subtercola sp. PAMC28395]|uniref:DUF2252 domain-containing protein n=1 Tax=Subtercola sp. PAMC28395 TaxID=2846775 RepID=UPI001C0D3D5F|nr:DUF2252 domain-containing protein [Subtercola sp. PAMC28395]QWT24132.1 DUF2252 domain-containing protein [Subtercola sp. PAMC28395]
MTDLQETAEQSSPESEPEADASPPADAFDARRSAGREARKRVPRSSHAGWTAAPDRADPVELLEEQAVSRVPELVPIRYGRMLISPFTFYRGAALIMAADLSTTPNSGLITQLCGDAHLSNFGVFGTPERTLIFDINDFDETLPGPFEWDLKRLAASFEIAGRYREFSEADRRAITLAVTRAYRKRMRAAAEASVLESWYDRLDAEQLSDLTHRHQKADQVDSAIAKRTEAALAKARTRDSAHVFTKLVGVVDGRLKILANPPLIVPVEDLDTSERTLEEEQQNMKRLIERYQNTLIDQHHPIREFTYLHMARKVVGVGSVGTRAWVLLFEGRDAGDPLLLQAKEAQASVLERFLPPSIYQTHGERVVRGQRMMQSASDIFLGWHSLIGFDGIDRDFYLRQLHDWKGSVDVENMVVKGALIYAQVCGETLARAHARSGDRVAIAAYIGKGTEFDEAITSFATEYADQNEKDYDAFAAAVASGRLVAQSGL